MHIKTQNLSGVYGNSDLRYSEVIQGRLQTQTYMHTHLNAHIRKNLLTPSFSHWFTFCLVAFLSCTISLLHPPQIVVPGSVNILQILKQIKYSIFSLSNTINTNSMQPLCSSKIYTSACFDALFSTDDDLRGIIYAF